MKIDDVFVENDKRYIIRDGSIEVFPDILEENDIILNDTSIDKNNAFNRNINILYNKLDTKLDKDRMFDISDIEVDSPSGHILMSEGMGQLPVWVSPEEFKSSLSENEVVYSEGLFYDSTTIDSSLFSSYSGTTITNNISFISNDNEVILNTVEIPLVVDYTLQIKISPFVRGVLSYSDGKLIIDGVGFDDTYRMFVLTDNGISEIDINNVDVSDSTIVNTSTAFSGAYKAYIFKLDIETDIYETTRLYKTQHIEQIEVDGSELIINYHRKECNGTKFDMKMSSSAGMIISQMYFKFNQNKE